MHPGWSLERRRGAMSGRRGRAVATAAIVGLVAAACGGSKPGTNPSAGGGKPPIFDEKLHNLFFAQPAPVVQSADVFASYILSLPADQQPKTAAYPSLDDPFASPIADAVRAKFEAAGIKTVYNKIYPSESVDMTPIVTQVASLNPDIVVSGTQSNDAYREGK